MNESFYQLYKSQRNMIEQFRHKDLITECRTFVDMQEVICNNLDRKDYKYYERWKKENELLKEKNEQNNKF